MLNMFQRSILLFRAIPSREIDSSLTKEMTLFNNYLIAALLGMVFDNQHYQ